jgi:hypothetical protein
MRNLTDEFDFSLLLPECFVSLTWTSGLSGFCFGARAGTISLEGM